VKRLKANDCYLCGKPLSEPINDDHVPPSMFFAKSFRKDRNFNKLLTIPVHVACNRAWQADEEYFVYTFLPLVRGTASGDALWTDARRRMDSGRTKPLANAVMQEFKHKIRGVHLPPSTVAKVFDAERVHEVLWKIIRGLQFYHSGQILPTRWTCALTITPPGKTPPDHFIAFAQSGMMESLGEYQDVFAYSFKIFPEVNNLHYWAFNLWDRIIFTAAFHDPECSCEQCSFIGPRLPESLHGTEKI
jgi:hypothetical protein